MPRRPWQRPADSARRISGSGPADTRPAAWQTPQWTALLRRATLTLAFEGASGSAGRTESTSASRADVATPGTMIVS